MIHILGLAAGIMFIFFLGTPIIIITIPLFIVIDSLLWIPLKGIITKENTSEYNVGKNIAVMYLGRAIGLVMFAILSYFGKIAIDSGFINNPELLLTLVVYTALPLASSLVVKIALAGLSNAFLEENK